VHTCIYIYVLLCIYVYMCTRVDVFMPVVDAAGRCVLVSTCVHVYVHIHVQMAVYIFRYVRMLWFICTDVYVYHVFVYMYVCVFVGSRE